MIKFDIYNIYNKKIEDTYIDENIFDFYVRFRLLSEYVRYYRFKLRAGTHCNKSKGEVSGTNKKPFPQKGRGVARQGSCKNPHQRGGGVAFALKYKDYSYKFGKKKSILAFKNILGLRVKENSFHIINNFDLGNSINTGEALKVFDNFNFNKALIVDINNKKLMLSVRNLVNYQYSDVNSLSVYDILKFPKLLISMNAISHLENKILKRNLIYFKG